MRKLIAGILLFLCFSLPAGAEILITEVMASNGVYQNGKAYDWVELYNAGEKNEDLSGCYLSDSKKNLTKWAFPEKTVLKAHEYLLVYLTGEEVSPGKKSPYYASFKISASGDQVILTDRDGESRLAALSFPAQYGNISYGIPSGGENYLFLSEATPGKKNTAVGRETQAQPPILKTAGGFYPGPVTVMAEAQEGQTLRYTLNGDTPDEKAKVFPAEGLRFSKTGVLRLRAFSETELASPTVSATYFIGEAQPVPVISLITDEKYLFDQKTGALAKGNNPNYPNYEHEWEYPVHIEYYGPGGENEISQMGTFTAAGHSARQNAQKSIAIYARKAYGPAYFSFSPLPNRDYEEYKSLLLRSANSDAFSTRLRDPVISALAKPLNLIYQDALPIEVYINGEHWGHYNVREKINKYFVAQWEGIPLSEEKTVDAIDILARTGSDDFVQNGSNADWLALCDFCKKQDLNEPENLQYVLNRLDVDSLFTHAAFEIIIGNTDYTNIRMYRVPGGKWKYLLFDVEASFHDLEKDTMAVYIKPIGSRIQYFRHEPLNALLRVPEMKERFLKRFAEVLRLSFQWPDVEKVFLEWENTLEVLLPRHLARWPHFTMKAWRQNVDAVKYYARLRPTKITALLQKHMKLSDAEMEQYFGEVTALLLTTNSR